MDGSANPYLLQAGIIAAGVDGMEKKRDPGQPLFINMYTDGDNYPNLKKLPSDLENALEINLKLILLMKKRLLKKWSLKKHL